MLFVAAYSPTMPAPMMITLVGGIPLMPFTNTPLPLLALLKYWPAISITALPADLAHTALLMGLCPVSSFRFSKLSAVDLLSIIFCNISTLHHRQVYGRNDALAVT